MRRVAVSVLLLVPVAALGASSAIIQPWMPVVPGTIAIYQFDEGSGTMAMDSSGNAYHAQFANGPEWEPGLAGGGAVHCVAHEAYLSAPWVPIGTTWTIQAWTRFPLDNPVQPWRTLVKHLDNRHHIVVSSTGELGSHANGWQPSGYNVGGLTGWHLLTAVGGGGVTAFYIDAQKVGQSIGQEVGEVRILGNNAPYGQNWGAIDSLRIVAGMRSAADIAADANPVPNPPSGLAQATLAGASLAPGGNAHTGFAATLTPGMSMSATVAVEVEVKPAGVAFDGATGIHGTSEVAAQSPTTVVINGLGVGGMHWRARSVDPQMGPSPWVSFGAGGADLTMVNATPGASVPTQGRGADGRAFDASRPVADTEGMLFRIATSDGDGDPVCLQVEVQPAGSAFSGEATAGGPPAAAGQQAECRVLTGPGSYQWSYRAVDSLGAATAWTRFSQGAAPDFEIEYRGSAGPSGCAGSAGEGGASVAALAIIVTLFVRRPLR